MEDTYQEEERYYMAKKRVNDIKGFFSNLISYVFVNAGLLALNLWTSPNHLWFYWPLIGWGIGLIIHGMKAFNYLPFISRDWEKQKIKEFMDKDLQSQKKENWN